MNRNIVAAIGSIVVLQLTLSFAWAEDRFAKACLKNETKAVLKFDWKFGNEGWKTVTLNPGQEEIFSWKYATVGQDKSPYLFVYYDARMNGSYNEEKKLELYRAVGNTNCSEARNYRFRIEPNDPNFITLYHIN